MGLRSLGGPLLLRIRLYLAPKLTKKREEPVRKFFFFPSSPPPPSSSSSPPLVLVLPLLLLLPLLFPFLLFLLLLLLLLLLRLLLLFPFQSLSLLLFAPHSLPLVNSVKFHKYLLNFWHLSLPGKATQDLHIHKDDSCHQSLTA